MKYLHTKISTKEFKTKKKFGFFNFMFYICTMEIEEFLTWAKTKRQSFDSVINKIEEKMALSDEDFEFMENAFIAYERGDL